MRSGGSSTKGFLWLGTGLRSLSWSNHLGVLRSDCLSLDKEGLIIYMSNPISG